MAEQKRTKTMRAGTRRATRNVSPTASKAGVTRKARHSVPRENQQYTAVFRIVADYEVVIEAASQDEADRRAEAGDYESPYLTETIDVSVRRYPRLEVD